MKNMNLQKASACAAAIFACVCLFCTAMPGVCAASLSEMYENGVVSDEGVALGDIRDGIISDVSENAGDPLKDLGDDLLGTGRAGADDRFGNESGGGMMGETGMSDSLLPGGNQNQNGTGNMNGTGGENATGNAGGNAGGNADNTNGTNGMPSAERASDGTGNAEEDTGSRIVGIIVALIVVIVVVCVIYMLIPKKKS